jgi:hypothetical protein
VASKDVSAWQAARRLTTMSASSTRRVVFLAVIKRTLRADQGRSDDTEIRNDGPPLLDQVIGARIGSSPPHIVTSEGQLVLGPDHSGRLASGQTRNPSQNPQTLRLHECKLIRGDRRGTLLGEL